MIFFKIWWKISVENYPFWVCWTYCDRYMKTYRSNPKLVLQTQNGVFFPDMLTSYKKESSWSWPRQKWYAAFFIFFEIFSKKSEKPINMGFLKNEKKKCDVAVLEIRNWMRFSENIPKVTFREFFISMFLLTARSKKNIFLLLNIFCDTFLSHCENIVKIN